MEQAKLALLTEKAREIRLGAVKAVYSAASGHPGGSLSIADILSYLYFSEMNVDPKDPKKADRDRLVLSKGHTAPALYAALAARGYFEKELLSTFRQADSILQGHPDMKHIPGVDMTTGSLGPRLLRGEWDGAFRKDLRIFRPRLRHPRRRRNGRGADSEAAMFGAHYKLDNLMAFVDFNGLQIDGKITEVMNPTPLDEKFAAFGWNVLTIDAHDFDQIEAACRAARECRGKPTAVIAKSIKGRGVSFMENEVGWHGKAPNKEQYEKAVAELSV